MSYYSDLDDYYRSENYAKVDGSVQHQLHTVVVDYDNVSVKVPEFVVLAAALVPAFDCSTVEVSWYGSLIEAKTKAVVVVVFVTEVAVAVAES